MVSVFSLFYLGGDGGVRETVSAHRSFRSVSTAAPELRAEYREWGGIEEDLFCLFKSNIFFEYLAYVLYYLTLEHEVGGVEVGLGCHALGSVFDCRGVNDI